MEDSPSDEDESATRSGASTSLSSSDAFVEAFDDARDEDAVDLPDVLCFFGVTLWAGRGRGRGVGGKADEKVVLVVYVGNGGDLRLYNYWQCEERKKKCSFPRRNWCGLRTERNNRTEREKIM